MGGDQYADSNVVREDKKARAGMNWLTTAHDKCEDSRSENTTLRHARGDLSDVADPVPQTDMLSSV